MDGQRRTARSDAQAGQSMRLQEFPIASGTRGRSAASGLSKRTALRPAYDTVGGSGRRPATHRDLGQRGECATTARSSGAIHMRSYRGRRSGRSWRCLRRRGRRARRTPRRTAPKSRRTSRHWPPAARRCAVGPSRHQQRGERERAPVVDSQERGGEARVHAASAQVPLPLDKVARDQVVAVQVVAQQQRRAAGDEHRRHGVHREGRHSFTRLAGDRAGSGARNGPSAALRLPGLACSDVVGAWRPVFGTIAALAPPGVMSSVLVGRCSAR